MKKESEEYAIVFESGDPVRIGLAASLLEGSGIEHYVKNAGVQNLFGLGSLGGMNPLMGTMKIFVRPEDKVRAQEILKETVLETAAVLVPEEAKGNVSRNPVLRIGFFLLGIAILGPSLLFLLQAVAIIIMGWNGGSHRMTHPDLQTMIAGIFVGVLALVFSWIGIKMIRFSLKK